MHNKESPFLAKVVERKRLTAPTCEKHTHHLVMDIAGSGLNYEVGDCIGVMPTNPPELVERTLQAMGATGDELVDGVTLQRYLTDKANISLINRGLLRLFASQKSDLATLLEREQKAAFQQWSEEREVWDLLEEHPEVTLSPTEICAKLTKLMPRYYSIASSQAHVGDEIHLTVRHLTYTAREVRRHGICTHYLCETAPLHSPSIPLFIHPGPHFRLPPSDDLPMIMIGPGTGVAPYRAFLQERVKRGATGGHWLFFGEWTRAGHFFYEEYFTALSEQGQLHLSLAFSRDQADKHYVQHQMVEEGKELFEWLEAGAYLYVCGDAKQMAPDVEAALHEIISTYSSHGPRDYLKDLRKAGRYLRDVY